MFCILEPSAHWLPFLWSEASCWALVAVLICMFFLPSIIHPQPGFLGTGWWQLGVSGNRADLWGARDSVLQSQGSAGCLTRGLIFSGFSQLGMPQNQSGQGSPVRPSVVVDLGTGGLLSVASLRYSPLPPLPGLYLCARSGSCPPEQQ